MSYQTNHFDDEVVRLLKDGRVGLMPSDTIYGLSCLALDKAAVAKLHSLKGRDKNKSFIVLISDTKMLDLLSISKGEAGIAESYWPGPLTLVCRAPQAPAWLRYLDATLAIRQPDSPRLLKLIGEVGPLISTSANLPGNQPAETMNQAKNCFGDKLDFYVDAGELKGVPSTIVQFKSGKLEVLRQGAVKIEP